MGMFDLICPGCGEVNSVEASACPCGHIFNAVTGSYEAAELTLQEEQAYLEYLDARLGQLEYDFGFAESDVQHNPGNREKQQTLTNLQNEIDQLKQQRQEQLARIKVTRKVNDDLRAKMEKEQAALRAKAREEELKRQKEREKAEALKRKQEQEARRKAEAEEKARQAAQRKIQQALAQKAAEAEAQQKALAEEKARLAAQRKIQQALDEKEAEAARILAEANRIQQQNAQALAATEAIKQRVLKRKAGALPTVGAFKKAMDRADVARPEPELDSRSGLADAADDIKQPDVQECPVCTAELPLAATRCRCGYQFQTAAADMPSLTTGDFFTPPLVEDQETQQCPVCTADVPANARKCKCGYELTSGETTMPGLSLDGTLGD